MKYVLIVCVLLSACTQPYKARRILEQQGFKDVQMNGYDFFNCSDDDVYKDKFTAIAPNGQRVSGVVCAGLFFKGATIRFD